MSQRAKQLNDDAKVNMGIRLYGDAAVDETSNDFAMYSPEGNEAVKNLVLTAEMGMLVGGYAWQVKTIMQSQIAEIRKEHPEVGDTMVRETIFARLEDGWVAAYGSTVALEDALS